MGRQREARHGWQVGGAPLRLSFGRRFRLGSRPGELEVMDGRVWLTRVGDLADHVLAAGESIALDDPRGVVVEAWDARHVAVIAWRPRSRHEPLRAAWRIARSVARSVVRSLSRSSRRRPALDTVLSLLDPRR